MQRYGFFFIYANLQCFFRAFFRALLYRLVNEQNTSETFFILNDTFFFRKINHLIQPYYSGNPIKSSFLGISHTPLNHLLCSKQIK